MEATMEEHFLKYFFVWHLNKQSYEQYATFDFGSTDQKREMKKSLSIPAPKWVITLLGRTKMSKNI